MGLAPLPIVRRLSRSFVLVAIAALLVTGCASTRVGSVGRLPNDDRLVTLVVTEDRKRVDAECNGVPSLGTLVGCHVSRRVELEDAAAVQVVKIVRLTDRLPSAMAFEIEAHELCHAVAGLQAMRDPCHDENHGVLTSAPAPSLGISLR
jgi:hypothetical protein